MAFLRHVSEQSSRPKSAGLYAQAQLGAIAATVPITGLRERNHQVGPILFFAFDAGGYATGITIEVNGGRFMM